MPAPSPMEMLMALGGSPRAPTPQIPMGDPGRTGRFLAEALLMMSPVGPELAAGKLLFPLAGRARHLVKPNLVGKFQKIADTQRGVPERRMLAVQDAQGGGVINPVVENVGDLTHRMNDRLEVLSEWGRGAVLDKSESALRALRHPYGFIREHRENLVANALTRGVPLERHTSRVNDALDGFAEAHRAVPVFNRPQKLARDAAIAVGEQNFTRAERLLDELVTLAKDPDAYYRALNVVKEGLK